MSSSCRSIRIWRTLNVSAYPVVSEISKEILPSIAPYATTAAVNRPLEVDSRGEIAVNRVRLLPGDPVA